MPDQVTIAVDAMGGDSSPSTEVEGAILAAREFGVRVLLCGPEDVLKAELYRARAGSLPIEVVNATEVITMEDSASKALRNKRDASVRVAAREVRDGHAHGMISAGNTGACMAVAKTVMGVVPGVKRPALAQVFPTLTDTWTVVVDVGANVDSTPEMLAQFAVMGSIYSRTICGCSNPRVGLLSIGEEEHKGNELTKLSAPLLRELPLNYIGNVEGRDLYSGIADVVVCDGFIGNVALKVSEGLVAAIRQILKESLEKTVQRKIGYVLAKEAFEDFRKRVDYSEYGGAPLLGVKGVCPIRHGRSNTNAIKNAIRVAAELAPRQGRCPHRRRPARKLGHPQDRPDVALPRGRPPVARAKLAFSNCARPAPHAPPNFCFASPRPDGGRVSTCRRRSPLLRCGNCFRCHRRRRRSRRRQFTRPSRNRRRRKPPQRERPVRPDDNNAFKEVAIRLGTSATIIDNFAPEKITGDSARRQTRPSTSRRYRRRRCTATCTGRTSTAF
ncbi:MAG: phosphate acyltransferase PlsX [Bryobacterales bacterium]